MPKSHLTLADAIRLRDLAEALGKANFYLALEMAIPPADEVKVEESSRLVKRDARLALTDELSRLSGEPIT